MHYFTITAGRTGTAWLASFLSQNLKIEEMHEPLEINDFGEKMPDIRTMRNFNNFGNNKFVKNFWERKFSYIYDEVYAETNHTLCKCGLVENIVLNDRCNYTNLIILRRNVVKQCVSYFVRNDFQNITIPWQWYLHPSYKMKIINPEPFLSIKGFGLPLWYCYELAARQEYYVQKFSDKINMVEIQLEEVVKVQGAEKLYNDLGLSGKCIVPSPKNITKRAPRKDIVDAVNKVVSNINVNMKQLVHNAIKSGFSF